jgi:phosphatidylinositol alpha-mannosyltransferase
MRIGIVCPYSWHIPGGVQAHVRDLAEKLIELGHDVSVLAPGDSNSIATGTTDEDDAGNEGLDLPPYVVLAGRAVPIPYNGSVARLQFGFLSAARVRRWLKDGDFDVVHVHEPAPPSLSLLTLMLHDGPMVATFHVATTRSRFLSMFETALQPFLEKLSGRIAVSDAARKVIVEHLGADAVVIPNGVDVAKFAEAEPFAGYPTAGQTIGFIGRYGEPRKGMDVLVDAVAQLVESHPQLNVLVAGRGDAEEFHAALPREVSSRFELLGMVSEQDKARMLRSVDVYCAPNTGQESFGVILLEAMAAGAPVVASDLDAFRRVLADDSGELFAVGSADALTAALRRVLDDPNRRAELVEHGSRTVAPYDWSVLTREILRVYELAIAGAASTHK